MTYAKWVPMAVALALAGTAASAQNGRATPTPPAVPQAPLLVPQATPQTPSAFQQQRFSFQQQPFGFGQQPFGFPQTVPTAPTIPGAQPQLPGTFGFQPGFQPQLPGALPPGFTFQNGFNPNLPPTAVSGNPQVVPGTGGYGGGFYGYPGYGYPGYGYPGYGNPGYGGYPAFYPGMMGAPNAGMYLPQTGGQYAPNAQYGGTGTAGRARHRTRDTANANTADRGTDARQAQVALNAEELMNERPLREGRVIRAASANVDVRVRTDDGDQSRTYPADQVFFFRTNGDIATAALAPNVLRTGDKVLVPEPGPKEPTAAVAGSRETTVPTTTAAPARVTASTVHPPTKKPAAKTAAKTTKKRTSTRSKTHRTRRSR